MKCSLLTLSTFIDGELAPQRRAEVDAHLVGCTRCSAGAATLREERSRIGQLARVSVDPASTQLMLEQVGIAIDPTVGQSPALPPPPAPPDVHRPWQGGTSSPSLPWTPRRPQTSPIRASDEIVVAPTLAPDVQPDLPLDGVRAVPPSWNRAPAAEPPSAPELEAPASGEEPRDAEWAEADATWLDAAVVPESWEADLPPPADSAPPATAWTVPAAAPAEPIAPPPPDVAPDVPVHAPPPTRLAAASGPGALWARMRDSVRVRLALARGGEALEDSVQIVSGAPVRRGAQLPEPTSASGIVAAPPAPRDPVAIEPAPAVELSTAAAAAVDLDPAVDDFPEPVPVDERIHPRHRVADLGGDRDSIPADATGWNAFAASSYPDVEIPAGEPMERRTPRHLGRHSRAVAREQVPLSTRLARLMSAAAGTARGATGSATARLRQGAGRMAASGPDNRLLAGIAGIGLIFVVALIIGHGSSRPATPSATRPTSTTTQPQTHQSTPAQSSAAAITGAAPAPAPAQAQTFGAGDTGFQVIRLRYGAQTSSMRVVFDLGPASARAGAAGTPKVTVSFSGPTIMLVTFTGTLASGSTGTPTPGKVISSVSLVTRSGGKTVYRFALTRAATATAFYLGSPTRFVLDIH